MWRGTLRPFRLCGLVALIVAFATPDADARLIRVDRTMGFFNGSLLAGDGHVQSDIFTTIETPPDGDLVEVPFSINFFGTTYNELYINENGVLSFGAPFSALPGDVPDLANTGVPLIAGFFADADMGTAGNVVLAFTFESLIGGPNMLINLTATYHGAAGADPLINRLQFGLIDKSGATGNPGDFRLELNYDEMQWESGDRDGGVNGLGGIAPRIGFTNGFGLSHEVPGSGLNGALLNPILFADGFCDSNALSVGCNDYVFEFRNGLPVGITTVPEPGTASLLAGGLFAILFGIRRRFRRATG